jgi:hypothetical protein
MIKKEEIFTINDKVLYQNDNYIINKFEIDNNKIKVWLIGMNVPININEIEHYKTPLFTTHDNVEIFEGDVVYCVDLNLLPNLRLERIKNIKKEDLKILTNVITFSSEAKAEEFILLNKPCLSIEEITKNEKSYGNIGFIGSAFQNRLKELVKSKLKQ